MGAAPWVTAEQVLSGPAAFIEAGVALNAFDSSSWLGDVGVPAAVVITSRDRVVAPWRQRAMADLLPGARSYVVEAGHGAICTDPDAYLPVLNQACRKLAGGHGSA
jgi:3-oxoadipate enol-lactonase